jgi:transcriptional regulator with XRE-family HTH domain
MDQGDQMPSPLGEKIRTYRKQKRMTLDQLAAKTRSSKSYLWELENRDAPPHPSAEKIFAIAAALGVTPEFLLEQEESEAGETVLDEAFYRKYRRMPPDTKRRLRQILDAWDEEY